MADDPSSAHSDVPNPEDAITTPNSADAITAQQQAILAGREPWQLSREEYLAYLKTLDPQDWFYETEDWGEIVRCEFDALTKRLVIGYDLQKHEPSHLHTLVFDGVRAVYFESGREGRLVGVHERIAWDTSNFRPAGLGAITMSAEGMRVFESQSRNDNYIGWLRGIPAGNPNFILSLGAFHETLSIEASRVTIDERVFEVGYPMPWREA